jgi:hypothetical protein
VYGRVRDPPVRAGRVPCVPTHGVCCTCGDGSPDGEWTGDAPPCPPPPPPPDLVGEIDGGLQEMLTDLEPEPPATGPGRPRILPSLARWAAMLVGVLPGEPHQRAIWRRLRGTGRWHVPRFPISDEAVSQRLAGAGTAPLAAVVAQVSPVLAARLAPWPGRGAAALAPFARAGVASDEPTLDPAPRTLPRLRGTPAPPAARDDAGPRAGRHPARAPPDPGRPGLGRLPAGRRPHRRLGQP